MVLYEKLLFWMAAMVVFTLTIAMREILASRSIREKAETQANLLEAINKLVEERANLIEKNERYSLMKLQMKEAKKEFQKILVEEKKYLRLHHQQFEWEMLGEQATNIAALRAKYDGVARETEARIQALGEENSRLGNEKDAQITIINAKHAGALQKATGELKVLEEDNKRLKKENDDLTEALARTAKAVDTEKIEYKQKGPGVDKETARIIRDLQASLAAAGREAQEWRTEAYTAIVRRMPPSQRGLSLFSMDVRNFPMTAPLPDPSASLPLASAVGPSGHSNVVSGFAPSLPPGLAVGPNGQTNPVFSPSAPLQASLNPAASEFWVKNDMKMT